MAMTFPSATSARDFINSRLTEMSLSAHVVFHVSYSPLRDEYIIRASHPGRGLYWDSIDRYGLMYGSLENRIAEIHKAAMTYFGVVEPSVMDAGAAEYDEAMRAQDMFHG